MIEFLQGALIEKSPTKVVILCAGVGYGAHISLATFEQLPELEDDVSLFIYHAVREDAIILFGFSDSSERDMFVQLTGVSGVGPKTAIGMLSSMGADQVRDHIANANVSALTTIPGIGKKSAERIVLELRDKVMVSHSSDVQSATGGTQKALVRGDTLAALVELGYSRAVAEKAIRAALKSDPDSDAEVEILIRGALREMQRS